jgi:hypothetical protein
VVNSTSGQGVQFCTGNTTATANLSAGKIISTGAGSFSAGILLLRQFAQTGTTAQNLSLTGTAVLVFGPSSAFGGNITTSSPALYFNGSTFNGTVNCTKTGTSNDQSQGNNIFNGAGVFNNNGTGYLLMTVSYPDAYNNNVSFAQNSTGIIYPNYNNNSTYAGDLNIKSGSVMTFGSNTGTATFSGSGGQTISVTGGTPTPIFTRLVIANSGSGVSLGNTSINVSKSLTMSSGLLNTNTTYMLTMMNGSVTAAGNALSTSYVNGPMKYQKASSGVSTLNFPIGNNPDCRPVALTINHSSNNLYTYQAQLFNASAAALGYTLPITVDVVSSVHYYTISRVNSASVSQPTLELSGNQTIQVFFGSNDVVVDGGKLTIVKNTYNALTKWIDIGGSGGPVYSGANLSGSIISTSFPSAFNSFSTFAIADQLYGGNILPVNLLDFIARPDNKQVNLTWVTSTESNNSDFTVEKSRDGINFEFVQKVNSLALNGNSSIPLNYSAKDLNPYNGTSYYRLKQTDLDNNLTYSKIAIVNFDQKQAVAVYPNPASGTIFISGISLNESRLKVEWFDLSGRSILQQTATVQSGIAKLNTPFSNGVYLLKFTTSTGDTKVQSVIVGK